MCNAPSDRFILVNSESNRHLDTLLLDKSFEIGPKATENVVLSDYIYKDPGSFNAEFYKNIYLLYESESICKKFADAAVQLADRIALKSFKSGEVYLICKY